MPKDPKASLGRRGLLLGRNVSATPPALVAISSKCLALRGVACMTCRDACSTGAIRFTLALGGAVPRIEADACTGCADCAAVCPVSAIALAAPTMQDSAVA